MTPRQLVFHPLPTRGGGRGGGATEPGFKVRCMSYRPDVLHARTEA